MHGQRKIAEPQPMAARFARLHARLLTSIVVGICGRRGVAKLHGLANADQTADRLEHRRRALSRSGVLADPARHGERDPRAAPRSRTKAPSRCSSSPAPPRSPAWSPSSPNSATRKPAAAGTVSPSGMGTIVLSWLFMHTIFAAALRARILRRAQRRPNRRPEFSRRRRARTIGTSCIFHWSSRMTCAGVRRRGHQQGHPPHGRRCTACCRSSSIWRPGA